MSGVCTIYTDASHHPVTGCSAVAFRAKFQNMTLAKALPITGVRRYKAKRKDLYNVDMVALEIFAILYAIRCIRRAGWRPDVWFINCDNINVCYLFWPWRTVAPSRHVKRYFNTIKAFCGNSTIRVKHIKGHTNNDNVRAWSNNYCDSLARRTRRVNEGGACGNQ